MNDALIPHVVIVGGGAGGLLLAAKLGRRLGRKGLARITLVDGSLTHLWKPLLHQVAAGTMAGYEDEVNFFIHAQRNGYHFQFGRVCGLDRDAKRLTLAPQLDQHGDEVLPERTLEYDTVVFAVGSQCNDFGCPGVAEHALVLDDRSNAELIHGRFLHLLLRQHEQHRSGNRQPLNLVIVGGGATGVELAAELHDVVSDLPAFGIDDIDLDTLRVTLLEAGDKLVAPLGEKASATVEAELRELGIDVRLNAMVGQVEKDQVAIKDGDTLPAALTVWAAGVKGPVWLRGLAGLETNNNDQLVVGQTLQTSRDPDVFALGDCAALRYEENGKEVVVPAQAQAAEQQARYLAEVLPDYLGGHAISRRFRYRNRGSLVTLASEDAVGNVSARWIGAIGLHGLLARWAYNSLHRRHQLVLFGPWRTAVIILKDWLTQTLGPKVKLH